MERRVFLVSRIRWLTHSLILSALLNLIFLSIFFYFFVRENPLPFLYDFAPAALNCGKQKNFSNHAKLSELASLSYEKLVAKLEKKTFIEDGYLERDLSLAILCHKYHFDIARALGKKTLSSRTLAINAKTSLNLFPNLTDDDYKNISLFLSQERFPLTNQGLFLSLKKTGLALNPPLAVTFCRTQEYMLAEMLFQNAGIQIKKKWLLNLLLEGKWETLSSFYQAQSQALDLSSEARRDFLLTYLKQGSKTAAQFFLLTDREFALKKLTDRDLCLLLDALPHQSQKTALFAKELLGSLRGDLVHQKAEEIAQIRPPRAATGELRPAFRDRPLSSPTPKQHIIQKGETLATISERYQLSQEELMRLNHLPSPNIRPGNILKLP